MFVHIGQVWKNCFGWPHDNIDETKRRLKNTYFVINSVWPKDTRRSDQWGISWQLPKELGQYFYVLYSRRPIYKHFLSWFWRGIYFRLQVSDITMIIESISYIYSIYSLGGIAFGEILSGSLQLDLKHFESTVQCQPDELFHALFVSGALDHLRSGEHAKYKTFLLFLTPWCGCSRKVVLGRAERTLNLKI